MDKHGHLQPEPGLRARAELLHTKGRRVWISAVDVAAVLRSLYVSAAFLNLVLQKAGDGGGAARARSAMMVSLLDWASDERLNINLDTQGCARRTGRCWRRRWRAQARRA